MPFKFHIECTICGSEENLTHCIYCGYDICEDCVIDHEPDCEDNEDNFEDEIEDDSE